MVWTAFDRFDDRCWRQSNRGQATAVDQTNRTYNQTELTTTTTTAGPNESISNEPAAAHAERESNVFDKPDGASQRPVTAAEPLVTGIRERSRRSGRADGRAGEEAAVRAFEDANGRRSTPAERQLLRGLADRFDPAARERSEPGRDTGWAWLTAAVYEAVEAGSAFVAPRRLREIMARWEREGLPSGDGSRQTADGSDQPSAVSRLHGTETADLRLPAADSVLGDAPDFALPHGFGSRRTWEFAISLLSGALEPGVLRELVAGTAIVGYRDGEVTIAAPDANQAERIAGDYAGLIARKLGEAMRRPVRLAVLLTAPPAGPPGDDRTNPGERDRSVVGAGRGKRGPLFGSCHPGLHRGGMRAAESASLGGGAGRDRRGRLGQRGEHRRLAEDHAVDRADGRGRAGHRRGPRSGAASDRRPVRAAAARRGRRGSGAGSAARDRGDA